MYRIVLYFISCDLNFIFPFIFVLLPMEICLAKTFLFFPLTPIFLILYFTVRHNKNWLFLRVTDSRISIARWCMCSDKATLFLIKYKVTQLTQKFICWKKINRLSLSTVKLFNKIENIHYFPIYNRSFSLLNIYAKSHLRNFGCLFFIRPK